MVVALLVHRNQLATRYDRHRHDVRALVEKLGRRIEQHAVLLGDDQEPVIGKAGAVRNRLRQRRGKVLHLVRNAVFVAVGNRPDLGIAGANEGHNDLRSDGHVARIGNDGIELDLEAVRQRDPLESLLNGFGVIPALLNDGEIRHPGRLECTKLG